jgi:hypothetical protein
VAGSAATPAACPVNPKAPGLDQNAMWHRHGSGGTSAMTAPITRPAELADFDLFQVWIAADTLTDRFDPFSFQHRMAADRVLVRTARS